MIPSLESLFKTIQSLLEKAHRIMIHGINKARRLRHVDCLLQMTMEESTTLINLLYVPTCRNNQREHSTNSNRFYNRTICLKIINTFLLMKTFCNQASLLALNTIVDLTLDVKNPLSIKCGS